MPARTKRTWQVEEEEEEETIDAPPTPPPTTGRQTRRTITAPSSRATNPTTPTRPSLVRSTTTFHLAPTPPPLTRTASLEPRPTARRNVSTLGSSTFAGNMLQVNATAGPSRTLTRTMSSSSALTVGGDEEGVIMCGAPAGGRRPKGGDPDEPVKGSGYRGLGRGKENIPPPPDDEAASEAGSRKRARVARSASGASTRGRSSSIVSVRSDVSSHISFGPSASMSRMSSRLPSASPALSLGSATAPSVESLASPDPLDLIEYMDVDKTPTKPRIIRSTESGLPTPPPSSPLFLSEVESASKSMASVHMGAEAVSPSADVEEPHAMIKLANPYKQLKSTLRLSCTAGPSRGANSVIVGREEEKAVIRSYLTLESPNDAGLYVSGPPGTGKTALVTALGREMSAAGWCVVEIGCMGLKAGDLWARLGQALDCGSSEAAVRGYLYGMMENVMIILDEVDSLMPSGPAAAPSSTSATLSKIFGLPMSCRSATKLKLVAISNTLDLTVRAGLSLPNGAQPQVLPFKAYVANDMVSIINSRIAAAVAGLPEEDVVKVDTKAVELLTRKVEAQNGDLRMCLGCLTAAIGLAEAEWSKKTLVSPEGVKVPLTKVAIPHAIKAFNSHTQQLKAAAGTTSATPVAELSPAAKKIRSVTLQGKMVLVSIIVHLARIRAGLPGCPTADQTSRSPQTTPTKGGDLSTSSLYATYSYLLSHSTAPFPPAAESDYRDLLSNLESLGLVVIGSASTSGGRGRGSSSLSKSGPNVKLSTREEEVKAGLGLNLAASAERGMADEEVYKVWDREQDKVKKAIDRLAKAAAVSDE